MLVGREQEITLLQEALESKKAEMIAVIGRRRVGKTFLIDTIYENQIVFKQTGIRNASNADQLRTFTKSVEQLAGKKLNVPTDWLDAFYLLRTHLKKQLSKKKKVVLFFDELSWLAVPKSNFLDYLGHFWNEWAYKQQNLVIVLCGSASSWIIQKVINDKGGLHNRITRYLHLKPFTLKETEIFLQSRNCKFTQYQIVQIYMAFGGVPLYLEAIKRGKSAVQNINDICFSETGLLKNEFNRLYAALFDNAADHIAIIKALASKKTGLTRTEIIALSKVPNGSSASKVLEELEQSDFIMAFHPFKKKKKDKIYRLIDEYSLFFLKFIEDSAYEGAGTFLQLSSKQKYKIWCGYAYEGICMKHVPQIKKALGIAGVYSTTHSYFRAPSKTEEGIQIDMLIDRADRVINLFEIKFYDTEFSFTKVFASKIEEHLKLFKRLSKTRNQIEPVIMTTFGLKHNNHSIGLVDNILTLEDLFD